VSSQTKTEDYPCDPAFLAVEGGRVLTEFHGERWRLPYDLLLKLLHDADTREYCRRAVREAMAKDTSIVFVPFFPEDQQ
jgi:hypothetical protein